MAALDPNNTARAYVDYEVAGQEHTFMTRIVEDATDAEVSAEISSVFTAWGPLVFLCTFLRFRRSIIHSNVTLPSTWTGAATWGSGVGPANTVPNFWSITGRDVLGHKVRWDMYGKGASFNSQFRLQAADDSTVEAVIAAIDATEGTFVTIADRTPLLNSYMNEAVSAYWQRQLRKG